MKLFREPTGRVSHLDGLRYGGWEYIVGALDPKGVRESRLLDISASRNVAENLGYHVSQFEVPFDLEELVQAFDNQASKGKATYCREDPYGARTASKRFSKGNYELLVKLSGRVLGGNLESGMIRETPQQLRITVNIRDPETGRFANIDLKKRNVLLELDGTLDGQPSSYTSDFYNLNTAVIDYNLLLAKLGKGRYTARLTY